MAPLNRIELCKLFSAIEIEMEMETEIETVMETEMELLMICCQGEILSFYCRHRHKANVTSSDQFLALVFGFG